MEGATPTPRRERSGLGPLLALLAGAAVLLTLGLGAKDVWEPSEGRPLQSAREMRWRGDWLVQYTNGQVDLTKPPLYAWLTGLAFRATGSESAWAGRLPSVLATLGVLAVVHALARRAAGPRAGLLAAFLCLTQARVFWQARLAELETLLALGVLLAYAALPRALGAARPGARAAWSAAFHAALGFAFAVKGPVALLLVLPGGIAWAVLAGRGRALASGAFLAGAPAFLAVGLAWYVAVVLREPGARDTFLSYAAGENVGHLRNVFYYFWQWPANALPWTPLVVLGGLRVARDARARPPAERGPLLLPLVAFAVTFAVQTALHAKQTHYLVPVVFPMGAVLAAVWVDRALADRSPGLTRASAAYAGVLGAAAGTFLAWGALGARFASVEAGLGASVLVGVGTAWACVVQAGRRPAASAAVVGLWVVALLAAGGFLAAGENRRQSSRAFLEAAAARIPPGAPVAWTIFGSHSDYLWYLPERVVTVDGIPELVGKDLADTVGRVRGFLAAEAPRYAIVSGAEADALGRDAVVLLRDDAFQKKRRRVALVTNGPGARGVR